MIPPSDVHVTLHLSLGDAGNEEVRRLTEAFLTGLLEDLNIPAQPKVSIAPIESGPLAVTIGDRPARVRRRPAPVEASTPLDAARQIASILFDNREALITPAIAVTLLELRDKSQPRLSADAFMTFLRLFVRYGFHLGEREPPAPNRLAYVAASAEDCFESAVASLGNLRVLLHHAPGAKTAMLEEKLRPMYTAFFLRGTRVPYFSFAEDALLRTGKWRLQLNDMRLPVFNATAHEGVDAEDDAIQQIMALLRRHAAALMVADSVEYEMNKLPEGSYASDYGKLIRMALSTTQIVRVLRGLVAEGVIVFSPRKVFDAMLAARTVVKPDDELDWLVVPYALEPRIGGMDDFLSLLECVRRHYRSQFENVYGSVAFFLLDEAIEKRITEIAASPQLRTELVEQMDSAFGSTPGGILTNVKNRRAIRQLIEIEFPDVPVLSFQEFGIAGPIQASNTISVQFSTAASTAK